MSIHVFVCCVGREEEKKVNKMRAFAMSRVNGPKVPAIVVLDREHDYFLVADVSFGELRWIEQGELFKKYVFLRVE